MSLCRTHRHGWWCWLLGHRLVRVLTVGKRWTRLECQRPGCQHAEGPYIEPFLEPYQEPEGGA